MEFKIGDRVVLTQDYCSAKKGMEGVIKGCDEYRCAVEFDDEFDGGHECDGLTKPTRGHYIYPEALKKIEPQRDFEVGDRVVLLRDFAHAKEGMEGVIKMIGTGFGKDNRYSCVEFDHTFYGGHNCNGRTKDGRGHYIHVDLLKKIEPSHAFTLVITSKGDHTDAKLIHGKHTDKWVWVDRYKDDEYSEVAAIHAVIDKMFPAGAPVPVEEKPKRFTGKAVFNGMDRYFTQGNVYTFEDGTTTDDDWDERGTLMTYDDWKHWFEENFVVINNPEEL